MSNAAPALKVSDRSASSLGIRGEVKTELTGTITAGSILEAPEVSVARHSAPKAEAAPEGDWTSLGEGTWYEGLLTIYSDITTGQKWAVEIEESATTPGYYRMKPYAAAGNPIAELMGKTDDMMVYINATDPDKVYVDGDLLAYGMVIFSMLNTENAWNGYDIYGTLKDKVISFPAESFAYTRNGQDWYAANKDGEFKIALPGAVVKDYTFKMSAPYCATGNNVEVSFEVGADVTALKYIILEGSYPASAGNLSIVAAQGNDLSATVSKVPVNLPDKGMYTLLVAALDGTQTVGGAAVNFFMQDDEADLWENCGTATYSEAYLASLFNDVETEDLKVPLQQHKTELGRFRLVEPYGSHSSVGGSMAHSDHAHYLYINAVNPERVYVEPSPMGVSFTDYGDALAWSWAGRYVENDMAEEAATEGLYGKLENGVITMPDGNLLMALSKYNKGSLLTVGNGFKVAFDDPATVGIGSIEAVGIKAPREYFNLQGMKVENPVSGQLYIVRQGDETHKAIVR